MHVALLCVGMYVAWRCGARVALLRRKRVLQPALDGGFRSYATQRLSLPRDAAFYAMYACGGWRLAATLGVESWVLRRIRGYFNAKRRHCLPDVVSAFARANGIDDYPTAPFRSVDAFFARPLRGRPSTWEADEREHRLSSPCEGTVVGFLEHQSSEVWIKSKRTTLPTIGIPSAYRGTAMAMALFTLDVHNIHRVYAPIGGRIVARIDELDPLTFSHSVRSVAIRSGWDVLSKNRRIVLVIETRFRTYVSLVVVGGIGIETIDVAVREGMDVVRGEELATFHMGGSAVLLVVPAAQHALPGWLTASTALGHECAVEIGDWVTARREGPAANDSSVGGVVTPRLCHAQETSRQSGFTRVESVPVQTTLHTGNQL